MDSDIFDHLYENALKTYKIEHLNCTFLKEFSKAMYTSGYSNGFYEGLDSNTFNDSGTY